MDAAAADDDDELNAQCTELYNSQWHGNYSPVWTDRAAERITASGYSITAQDLA